MNTETKQNLIFLVIALAVMTPGFVTLFNKKMQPGAKPITMRDPVRKVAAYVDPLEMPDTMVRVVPEEAAKWVRSLTPAGANPTVRSETSKTPTLVWVSAHRKFELLVVGSHPQGTQGTILIWDAKTLPEEGNLQTSWDMGTRKVDGTIKRVERLLVPEAVVQSFLKLGYNKPTREVTLLHVVYPVEISEAKTTTLNVSYSGEHNWTDTLTISESTGGKRPSMVTGQ